MAIPVAVVTYDDTSFEWADLPGSRVFSAASSVPGTGASSIVGYQWYLISKPPTSSASLTGDTTVSCTLTNIDVPGTYRVFCVVEDDEGASSFDNPRPVQDTNAPYAFSVPPMSAFGLIRALTRYASLPKLAYGEQEWLEDGYWPVVDEVDLLRRDIGSISVLTDSKSVWVSSAAGSATADGSEGNPFNPTSAAANIDPDTSSPFIGPIAQGWSALKAQSPLGFERLQLNINGGVYDEDVSIVTSSSVVINCLGVVYLGDGVGGTRNFSVEFTVPGGALASAGLSVIGTGPGIDSDIVNLGVSGDFQITQANSMTSCLYLNGMWVYGDTVVAGTAVQTIAIMAIDCNLGSFTVPNANINLMERSRISGMSEMNSLGVISESNLGSVTVADVSPKSAAGFYDCNWSSGAVFNGPADTAKFDLATAGRFAQASGTYAGGASVNDHLLVGPLLRADTALTVEAVNGELALLSPGNKISVTALGDIDLETTSGEISLDSGTIVNIVAAESMGVFANNGEMRFANTPASSDDIIFDSGGKVQFEAEEQVTATGGGFDVNVTGDATVTSTGGAANVTGGASVRLLSGSGGVLIQTDNLSGGSVTIDSDDNVTVDANADVGITSGGEVAISAVEAVVATTGNTDFEVGGIFHVTADGNIILEALNTSISLLAPSASVGMSSGNNVTITPTNALVVNAGDGILLNPTNGEVITTGVGVPAFSSRNVVRTIASEAPQQATTGTAEQVLDSVSIPAATCVATGARLQLKAWYTGAANTNSKVYLVKLGGTTLYTTGVTTTSGDDVEFTIDIIALTSSTQRVRVLHRVNTTLVHASTSESINLALTKTLEICATTATSSGDVTLDHWTLTLYPSGGTYP